MAKPAATPTAANIISLFQLMGLASPLKVATGAPVVKVPLADGDGKTEIEAGLVGAWIWPSVIWETGATVVVALGAWI